MRSLRLPKESVYRVNMRDFDRTHAQLINIGGVDLLSRIHINKARAFVANARDVIPFDVGNFNIFFAAGLLISYACGHVDFDVLKLNYDYFNTDLAKLMKLNYLRNFYIDATQFYSKDKSRQFMRSFKSDGNLFSISLLPKFGYMQPTIECFVDTFELDWQRNAPYEIFVYSLIYQMFLNFTGFKSAGFNLISNITKCDVAIVKTFDYKWNLTPFTKIKMGSEPEFPTANDIKIIGGLTHTKFEQPTFLDTIGYMNSDFWRDILCVYRIGCEIENRKITQETFDLINDYSLRTFVRDKLAEFRYRLHAVKGESHRTYKKYKTKLKPDWSMIND